MISRKTEWISTVVAAIFILIPSLVLAQGDVLLSEDFSTDGDGDRYTLGGRGVVLGEPGQGWEHSFNLAGVEAGIDQYSFPARRVALPWSSALAAGNYSDDALSFFDTATTWTSNSTEPLTISFLAQDGASTPTNLASGDRVLYDRLVGQGHTVSILDAAVATVDQVTTGDLLLISDSVNETGITERYRHAAVPIVNYEYNMNPGLLLTKARGGRGMEQGIHVGSDHAAVPAGLSGQDIDWTNAAQDLPFAGTPRKGVTTLATYLAPAFTQVSSLAAVDAMIDGTSASTTAVGQFSEADLIDVIGAAAGNWDINNEVPGGGGDDYAIVAKGMLQVAQGQDFKFALGGDDGGRLRINGQDVIVDDTTHGFTDRFATINLPAGNHEVEWVGFERGGGAGFELAVSIDPDENAVDSNSGAWDVVQSDSFLSEIKLDGTWEVTTHYLDVPNSPLLPSDVPAIIAADIGTTLRVHENPFHSSTGGAFLLARDADDPESPNPDLPKTIAFPAVDVSAAADPKVTVALAADVASFNELEDTIAVLVNGQVVGEFLPEPDFGSLAVEADPPYILTPTFKNFTFDIPAGVTNAEVTIEVANNEDGEMIGVDSVLVTDGAPAVPLFPQPNNAGFQQGINGYAGTVDTEVQRGNADTTYGDELAHGPDPNTHVLVRFDDIFGAAEEGKIPLDANIEEAFLMLEVFEGDEGSIAVHRMLSTWDGNSTWNSMDDGILLDDVEAVSIPDDVSGDPVDDGYLVLDVTPSLRAFQDDPASNFGWVLIGNDDDAIFTSTAVLDIGIPALDRLAPRLEYVLSTVVDIDFSADGEIDGADIDLLCTEVAASGDNLLFDVDGSGSITSADVAAFLTQVGSLPGDADLNGTVEFADFLGLSANFGGQGSWTKGDFDCNNLIAFADFLQLSGNFGKTGAVAASVPEPSSMFLVVATMVSLFAVRRKR